MAPKNIKLGNMRMDDLRWSSKDLDPDEIVIKEPQVRLYFQFTNDCLRDFMISAQRPEGFTRKAISEQIMNNDDIHQRVIKSYFDKSGTHRIFWYLVGIDYKYEKYRIKMILE